MYKTIMQSHFNHRLDFSYSSYSTSLNWSSVMSEEGLPPPKKQKLKRQCHFDRKWVEEFQGIGRSSKG